jgi:hypothetical protein
MDKADEEQQASIGSSLSGVTEEELLSLNFLIS